MMSNSACLKGGATLFLTTLTRVPVPDRLDALLQRLDPPDVEADRRVELQRPPAGSRLGVAEHHADLLAELVREDTDGARPVQRAGELSQRLAHEARLESDEGIPHLALDLRLRRQRRDGVDRDDVDGTASNEEFGDLERLLAVVRL